MKSIPKAASASTAKPFFELNAAYHCDPQASAADLVHDGSALLAAGLAALDVLAKDDQPEVYWSALYLLQQASAVAEIASSALARQGEAA